VEEISNGRKLVMCGTHLTEKIVGLPGRRQAEMVQAILKQATDYPSTPIVVMGDMNINQVDDMPDSFATACRGNKFLHPHPDHDPYRLLANSGFVSAQRLGGNAAHVMRTVWNGVGVDYMGFRGLLPVALTVLNPFHDGYIISDHAFPAVCL